MTYDSLKGEEEAKTVMPSVLDAMKGVKEIAEIVKKYNDVPLFEKIVVLQEQMMEQATRLSELAHENKSLKEQCEWQVKTVFKNPYFYEQEGEVPLCPKCYSGFKLRIHLTHPSEDFAGGHGRMCRQCKEFYREGPRRTPRGGTIKGR